MAINEWWTSDANERYWLEVTDRESPGSDLIAPQLAGGGRETPSYTLVNHVRPGDVVLHWWKPPGAEAAIIGSSTASGYPFESTLEWQARGTYGRERGVTSVGDAWEAPITGFEEIDPPVTLERLREREAEMRALRDALNDAHGTTYFPFAFSDKRAMRTGQGYLFKFPVGILALFPELEQVRRAPVQPGGQQRGTRPQRRKVDPKFKKAVERHAVDWTLEYFDSSGFEAIDVGDTESFDVLALTDEGEELQIEVKGSSTEAIAVTLTDGEVKHWGHDYERVLVVDDRIQVRSLAGSKFETSGGRHRVWREWEIDDDALQPTEFRYTLPGHAQT